MTAEINTIIDSYSNEQAKKDLREELRRNFTPKLKNSAKTSPPFVW